MVLSLPGANPPDPVSATQQASDKFIRDLDQESYKANRQMATAYDRSMVGLDWELQQLERDIARKYAAGEAVPVSWLHKQGRYTDILQQAERRAYTYAGVVGDTVIERGTAAFDRASRDGIELLNASSPTARGVNYRWNKLPTQAVEQWQARLHDEYDMATGARQPLPDVLRSYGPEAKDTLDRTITQGLMVGQHPTQVFAHAQSLMRTAMLSKGQTLVTTEMYRAYREGNRQTFLRNRHIAPTWVWHAHVGEYTCAACLAMHGQEFPVDTPMGSHPRCRCTMLPKTKDWADIVGDESLRGRFEGVPKIPKGNDLFNQMDPAQQKKILGPKKFAAYQRGEIQLIDVVNVNHNRVWGTSRTVGSLDSAIANARRRGNLGGNGEPGILEIPQTQAGTMANGRVLPYRDADTPEWVREVDSILTQPHLSEADYRKVGNIVRKNNLPIPRDIDEKVMTRNSLMDQRAKLQAKAERFERKHGDSFGRMRPDHPKYPELRAMEQQVKAWDREIDSINDYLRRPSLSPADARRLEALRNEQGELHSELGAMRSRLQPWRQADYTPEERFAFRQRAHVIETEELPRVRDAIRTLEATNPEYDISDHVLDTVRTFREVGSPGRHTNIVDRIPNGRRSIVNNVEAQDAFEDAVTRMPTDWVRASQNPERQLIFSKTDRGFYSPGRVSRVVTSGQTHDSRVTTMVHEFGHRMEHMNPRIAELEKEWYARRVGNDKLVSMNRATGSRGYRADEKTRPDHFITPYVGKDYGGSYYEILSIGLESTTLPTSQVRYRILEDPDMLDFIIGLLIGV